MLHSRPHALGVAAAVALTITPFALAQAKAATFQAKNPTHFAGTVNDYTPATISGNVVGPWEIRGAWSMDLKGASAANFKAALNMEKSDYAITEGLVNVDDPSTRSPHIHTVTMRNATVSTDTGACPANNPANAFVFLIAGDVAITGNGNPALSGSQLTVCVSGGTGAGSAPYSNVELIFSGPATGHFGTQPIHGVVKSAN